MRAGVPALVRLALAVAVACAATGCGRGPDSEGAGGGERAGRTESAAPASPEQSGHERMRATLARIAEEVLATNRFLGEAELPELRERLTRLQPDGDAGLRIDLGLRIAVHELRLGRNEEALRLYAQGMAWLRVAEAANCIRARNCDSCIFPITGGGLHEDPTGSREAARCFLAIVQHPASAPAMALRARWLLDVLTSAWDYTAPLRLFRNRGDGRFDESTAEAGLEGLVAGLNLTHADYDNDGDADVLVLRGAWFDELGRHSNSLLRNDGSAHFTDVAFEAGLAEPAYPAQVGAWGDFDGDGRPDLYVSNFQSPNRLYRNLGDGRFTDVAVELGVELPLRSFSTWVWDYDNDGHLDIYCAASVEDVTQNVASRLGLPHADPSGRLYRNDGRGGFEDRSEQVGLDLLATTMGAGHGDLDNDGDQDIFEQMGGAFLADVAFNALYENPGNDNHRVRLELQGRQANRSAFGARVTVQIEEGSPPRTRTIHRQVGAAGSFGSAPLHLHIGLGTAEVIGKLTVLWPGSGTEQVFEQIAVDRFLRLVEGAEELVELPRRVVQLGGS